MLQRFTRAAARGRAGNATGAREVGRRRFLGQVSAAALLWSAVPADDVALAGTLPNPIGYSIISWPQKDLGHAVDAISSLGFRGVQLLGWVQGAYAGGKVEELRNRLRELNLSAAALSCSDVRLRPESPESFVGQFRDYANFLQALGGKVLQVIDAGKPQAKYSPSDIKSMGERMNQLGKIAQEMGMTAGYHPHFNTLGETREGLGSVLAATDPRYVGLIADVAHLKLGGADPPEVIETYAERLVLVHLKDLRQDIYEIARRNHDEATQGELRFCEIGRGVVDFSSIIRSLQKAKYAGWVIVELDTFEAPPGGPDEAARSNKQALQALGFKTG